MRVREKQKGFLELMLKVEVPGAARCSDSNYPKGKITALEIALGFFKKLVDSFPCTCHRQTHCST